MDAAKRKRLEEAGFKVGDASEFLGLSDAESMFVELKASLATALQEKRTARQLTQSEVASALGSSQSRVAKMEAGDPSVTVDLLVRSLFFVGASPKDLAKVFASLRLRRATAKRVTTKRARTAHSIGSKRRAERAHT